MTVFFLALFGMICWGIAPIFAKVGLNNINPMAGLAVRTLFAAGLVSSWVVCSGSLPQLKNISANSFILIGIEAILATLVGDLAYFAAIKKGDVSFVTIIMSSSPLITLLCSSIFLGEQITILRVGGAFFILIGIALIM
ncbi:MAG: EamA family transporter [Bacillota bacterium]|nr:EamA family transporter [Bacillota bacterium]